MDKRKWYWLQPTNNDLGERHFTTPERLLSIAEGMANRYKSHIGIEIYLDAPEGLKLVGVYSSDNTSLYGKVV